jgi:alcohol dehydrogenase, propanol-preferring
VNHIDSQYAKAKAYKIIALDVVDAQLEEAKDRGADHVFNTKTDEDYVQKIKEITKGGCDSVVNYTTRSLPMIVHRMFYESAAF